MGELAELIERVEKAEGPDRELDWAIRETFGGWMPLSALDGPDDGCWIRRLNGSIIEIGHPRLSGISNRDAYLPRYTASLDAVVALVEKQLPDWKWSVYGPHPEYPAIGPGAQLWKRNPGVLSTEPIEASGATPALALLAAFLKATQHQEKKP